MAKLILLFLVFAWCLNPAMASEPPSFESYPVEPWKGVPKPPILDSSLRQFRTLIREEVAKGPNFAGSYTVVTRGCGTDCKISIIVNDKTGVCYTIGVSTFGLNFRKDSRLLIRNPGVTADDKKIYGDIETEFFQWDGNTLTQIAAGPTR